MLSLFRHNLKRSPEKVSFLTLQTPRFGQRPLAWVPGCLELCQEMGGSSPSFSLKWAHLLEEPHLGLGSRWKVSGRVSAASSLGQRPGRQELSKLRKKV